MKNALTFDVEEHFQVMAFADHIAADAWDACESRVQRNTDRVLELLATSGAKATFFTLGWVAEKQPALVAQVARAGHEIACHSNRHRPVFALTPAEFREDTRRAKQSLENAGGIPVCGYRAPSFSIVRESAWAFDVLAELGFTYDSSIFPVRHPNYGVPHAPRSPFVIPTSCGPIVEFPMPSLELAGARAPFGGGAYLRLLPYWYTAWAIRFVNRHEGRPACVYAHPWELDPEQPRMQGRLTSKVRHYLGLRGMEQKLARLTREFEFTTLAALVANVHEPVCSF